MAMTILASGSIALLAMSLHSLPADLQPVAAELRRHGFRLKLAPPPVQGTYGLYQAKTRTLWVAPIAFELGIGRQTFLHEATHAAQSCPDGTLRPIGWNVTLAPVVEREISGILTTRYHHSNRIIEQEAFAMQGQADAPQRIIAALRKRC
ncbi:hypothetical protein [Synechococcus sp. 1G10]|uniref:hypothetical protein n=1 Tax=Synechococcus sp. 1G10 TaxID=2025605 RepID=UPI000B98EC39|nr:hypothetical protein [Synechococcus sp. 1G10]